MSWTGCAVLHRRVLGAVLIIAACLVTSTSADERAGKVLRRLTAMMENEHVDVCINNMDVRKLAPSDLARMGPEVASAIASVDGLPSKDRVMDLSREKGTVSILSPRICSWASSAWSCSEGTMLASIIRITEDEFELFDRFLKTPEFLKRVEQIMQPYYQARSGPLSIESVSIVPEAPGDGDCHLATPFGTPHPSSNLGQGSVSYDADRIYHETFGHSLDEWEWPIILGGLATLALLLCACFGCVALNLKRQRDMLYLAQMEHENRGGMFGGGGWGPPVQPYGVRFNPFGCCTYILNCLLWRPPGYTGR